MNIENFEFREACEYDAAALLAHLSKVGGETDNLTFGAEGFRISVEREARFISRFAKNEDEIMLVVMDGGTVVGNGVIERERIPRLSHRTRLTLTVLRDYWGQGIGSRLMEMMIKFCRESRASVISLEVRADNDRAVSLYRKFGFRTVGRMEKYFHIGEEYHAAYLMELIL
jgi:ribosomal protein S18 acetylase RimI-like enzyme